MVVLFVLFVLPLVLVIVGLVDAARRPEWAWQQAHQSKALWIILQAVGLLFCWVGMILAIVYLAAIRPKVAAAEMYGTGGGPLLPPAGAWPPGWYPDPSVPGQTRYWDGYRWM